MPSPFPGMDPYIESLAQWPDFHGRFINTLCETIADLLPEPYFARIQEDVVLLEPEPTAPAFKVQPDVLVAAAHGPRPARAGGVATLEPATLPNLIQLDPHITYFIEVVRLPEAKAVTVVEVLSPTNKQGGGRGMYTHKRSRILQTDEVNLVELDLLRAGRRIQLAVPFPRGDYHALVSRADRRPVSEVYSWSVRDPLPTIPIPLPPPTPDAAADLGRAFAMAYERGRYGRLVRYQEPPPAPAFSPEDAEWVSSQAKAAAR